MEIRIRQNCGSVSANTQEMIQDGLWCSDCVYGQVEAMFCEACFFFFFHGKARRIQTSILSAKIVYTWRFPNIPQISFSSRSYGLLIVLNLLDAQQNYLGRLLKIQILGPHPRKL